MPRTPVRKKTAKKPKSLLRGLFKWAFVLGLWAGIILAGIFAWYAAELPSITKSATFDREVSITVKAADGSIIGRYGDMKGDNIAAEDLPSNLIYAVLAIEDRRFYSHWGVDFRGIARAMVTNAMHGRFAQGGSTLTQQLAKNLFLSQERTLKRKIQEAMLAFWLETQLTKDEILSAYLNRVYMGGGAYGIDAASKLYFKKDVKDLSLEESAQIAGLLKAPSRYSPTSNPDLSKRRAQTVLKSMVDAGYITEDEMKAVVDQPPIPSKKPIGGDSARYYSDWIVDTMQDLIGTPTEDIIVETTMNPAIEKTATAALVNAIGVNGKEKAISQGAVVSIRPNGAVVAMVGGYDYAASQFNRASQARRQPGSSFKPFVYLAAIEAGWGPQEVMLDAPIEEGRYRPKNYAGEYFGEISLENALLLSLNTVTFRLIKEIGPAHVIDVARRLGITSHLDPDLSLGLGTASLSPLEMATAYAAIANGGMAIRPYGITKITSAKGDIYYIRPPGRESMRVVAAPFIDTITLMMQNVIEYGTGQRAKLPWPAYGKTGTSQDSRDAWFIGFTPELVTAVWMGNDDYSPMKRVTGGSFPADVWRQVMLSAKGVYPATRSTDFSSGGGFQSLMSRLISSGQEDQEIHFNQPRYEPGQPGQETYIRPPPPPEFPGTAHYND